MSLNPLEVRLKWTSEQTSQLGNEGSSQIRAGARLGVEGRGDQIGGWQDQVRWEQGPYLEAGARILRVGSAGMGVGTRLLARGRARQEQAPDWEGQRSCPGGIPIWDGVPDIDGAPDRDGQPDRDGAPDMDGVPDIDGDARQWMEDQIVDGILNCWWGSISWMGYQIGVQYQVGYQSGSLSHLTPLGGMNPSWVTKVKFFTPW